MSKGSYQESERDLAVQIMMLLTQQQARPDIPPLDTLPGPPLPGIEEYVQLMQVFHASSFGDQKMLQGGPHDKPCHCVMLCCWKTLAFQPLITA